MRFFGSEFKQSSLANACSFHEYHSDQLAITGIELGSVAKDVGPDHDRFVVMLVTAAALAGFRNDGIALICGLVVEILFYLAEEVKKGDILGLPSRMWSVFWDKVRGIEQKSVTKEEKDVVV